MIGSGKLTTMPLITEDGHTAEVPNGASSEAEEHEKDNVIKDKEVIQWKHTLHQIGKHQ